MSQRSRHNLEGGAHTDPVSTRSQAKGARHDLNSGLNGLAAAYNLGVAEVDELDEPKESWKPVTEHDPAKERHPRGRKVRFWKKKDWKRRKNANKARWAAFDSELRDA